MNIYRDPEAIIGAWLDDGPEQLPPETRQAIVVGVRTVPRHRMRIRWPFGDGFVAAKRDRRPLALALATLAIVAVIGSLVATNLRPQPFAPAATLPTSPGNWSRVAINSDVGGGVDSVFATPLGLLASVNEGDTTRWYFSVDGRTWTMVPSDQIPDLSNPAFATDRVSVAGNMERILVAGREVLASQDGISWSVIASPAQDPELGVGAINAISSGGPGFVAVGIDNKAWYSTDGSDWSLAAVPAPPGQPPVLDGNLDTSQTQGTVEMEGVARSGNNLIAWGKSIWTHTDEHRTLVPVFWTSADGMTWTSAPAPGGSQWDYPRVAGGANGFIASDLRGSVWYSTDGSSWENVAAAGALGPSRWHAPGQSPPQNDEGISVELLRIGIAAGPAGYVAVGTDGACMLACSSEELVIWTSPDGRSWSRLPNDDLFRGTSGSEMGAGAESIATWGDRFVVGGQVDGRPAVWISSTAPANDNPPPAPTTIPSTTPEPQVDLGIFAPVTGRIVYGNETGVWGLDPAADPEDPATLVQLASEAGTPLGWSRDGTKLLFLRQDPNPPDRQPPFENLLYILHADGTETQVTPLPVRDAAISPDGSLVAFSTRNVPGRTPHVEGLFVTGAEGGEPVRIAEEGTSPTFSPDGTRIAYLAGPPGVALFGVGGDAPVWLVNVDGTDAHEILAGEPSPTDGAAKRIKWSPAGDVIAMYWRTDLGQEESGAVYTFSTAGSDPVKVITGGFNHYWSPDGSQIAYACLSGDSCTLAIADADGSNIQRFNYGMSGPWHPGSQGAPLPVPSAAPQPSDEGTPSAETPEITALLNDFLDARIAGASETPSPIAD